MGDDRSASIVSRIAHEESAHVAVGVSWFRLVCRALDVDPGPTYRLAVKNIDPKLLDVTRFAHDLRQEVGLERDWYDRRHPGWEEPTPEAEAAAAAGWARRVEGPAATGGGRSAGTTGGGKSAGTTGGGKSARLVGVSATELAGLRERLDLFLTEEGTVKGLGDAARDRGPA